MTILNTPKLAVCLAGLGLFAVTSVAVAASPTATQHFENLAFTLGENQSKLCVTPPDLAFNYIHNPKAAKHLMLAPDSPWKEIHGVVDSPNDKPENNKNYVDVAIINDGSIALKMIGKYNNGEDTGTWKYSTTGATCRGTYKNVADSTT